MTTVKLKVAELRKQKGISQQELADVLGISFQSISKWETGATMPDIVLLPALAEYFNITVDELLGLKPLPGENYIPSNSGTKDYWGEHLEYLRRTRTFFWNEDYIQFLIEKVWHITEPVDILDSGCGYGFLGSLLLPFLPKGSTYTGVDFSERLIEEGNRYFANTGFKVELICEDFMQYKPSKNYDIVISQAVLRHLDKPALFLEKMIRLSKIGGLIICIDVNREIECDGLFIKGMDYSYLCSREGFRNMWKKEYECQGRDYSVAMKVPDMMKDAGLKNVDIRMNDRVNFVSPNMDKYAQMVSDFIESHHWDKQIIDLDDNEAIKRFMNHGMDRNEAESYCQKQRKIAKFINSNKDNLTYTYLLGLMISYGRK